MRPRFRGIAGGLSLWIGLILGFSFSVSWYREVCSLFLVPPPTHSCPSHPLPQPSATPGGGRTKAYRAIAEKPWVKIKHFLKLSSLVFWSQPKLTVAQRTERNGEATTDSSFQGVWSTGTIQELSFSIHSLVSKLPPIKAGRAPSALILLLPSCSSTYWLIE